MTSDEQIYHSNRGWLSVIAQKPKNILRVNQIAVDRLIKLGYTEIIGSYVVITDKGKYYINSLQEETKSDI